MRELTRVCLRFLCGPTQRPCKDTKGLITLSDEYNQHLVSVFSNILNANQNRSSTLAIEYIPYFYSVFPLHPNTFHQLFQHSTQPQLKALISLITKFYKLEKVVEFTLVWLYSVIVYLGVMAYVILVHLAYLLTSILGFNVIHFLYIVSVQLNLILIMNNIKKMLLKSSVFLYALMEILILHFCVIINGIFAIIKAKLLFYLKHLELQIFIDYIHLYPDLESFKTVISKLQSEVRKYLQILDTVKVLLNKIITLSTIRILKKDTTTLKELIDKVNGTKKTINKLDHKFSYQNHRISKTLDLLSSIKLERSIKSNSDNKELVVNLKMNLRDLQKPSPDIINLNIEKSLILEFNNCSCSIKNIWDMIDMADQEVSNEIMSLVRQLLIVETINLVKLNLRIYQIQLLYESILIRGNLLVCTIEFYTEIKQTMEQMFELMKFDCSDCREFLNSCSSLEKNCLCICDKIYVCIKKLREACKNNEHCGVPKKLIELYSKIIEIVGWLKFYVDLMEMEILIFKMIILNIIEMTVSSFYIDGLIKVILQVDSIDKAIGTLIVIHEELRAFYLIQLENTLTILGLSELLLFSESIHGYYYVLLLNLDLINRLIWVIECYIQHLFVFKFTSVGLNAIYPLILEQFKVITDLISVVKSMETITNKLRTIDKSIKQLNDIQEDTDITNWKEKSKGIRQETESINTNVKEINSQITEMSVHVKSISESWATLISLENFLKALISYVNNEFKRTNNRYSVAMGMGNQYYGGVILSVMEPCNKQLKLILGYLIVMTVVMRNLISLVQNAILIIYVKMGWLKGLTTKLQTYITNINKGVVEVECAIEGVVRNLIRCSLQCFTRHPIKNNITKSNVY